MARSRRPAADRRQARSRGRPQSSRIDRSLLVLRAGLKACTTTVVVQISRSAVESRTAVVVRTFRSAVESRTRMTGLRRALGFRDLVLFYLVTTFSLRWIATAAAAGPASLVFWAIAAACLFVPMVFTVLELSSRYPEEGGVYVWSKEAFGPFSAFTTGWMYWATNLPYFPGLLYFMAANALFVAP